MSGNHAGPRTLAVAAVLSILGALAGCAVNAQPQAGRTERASRSAPRQAAAPTQRAASGSTHPVDVWAGTCRPGQMTARLSGVGATMSQPFDTVALRNTSARSCTLRGYPRLRVFGYPRSIPSYPAPTVPPVRLKVRLSRGPIFERRDPGAHWVLLPPGKAASFNVGTVTAIDGGFHPVTLTRLDILLPHARRALPVRVLPVRVFMGDSHALGHRPPVGLTALKAGNGAVPKR